MAQVSMTVRMDAGIKAAFDSLCQQFGMSANAAMNIFANAVVKTRSIPFKIEMSEEDTIHEEGRRAFLEIRKMAEQGAFPDLTLDEINEEIRLAREGK